MDSHMALVNQRKDTTMFIVSELQTGETTAVLNFVFADRLQAEQKFHEVLAYAAVSQLPVHSAIMMTEEGVLIKRESYHHETEAE